MGSSPGLGRSHMPGNNWAREPQLLSLHVWSLCSATGEATIVRGPRTAMKSGPRLPQLEKALAQKWRPNTAKINKFIKKKKLKYGCQKLTLKHVLFLYPDYSDYHLYQTYMLTGLLYILFYKFPFYIFLRLEYEDNNSNYNSLQKLNGNNVSDSVLSALYTLMHIIPTTTQ